MLAQEGMTIDEAIAKEEFLQEECAAVIGGSSMTACSYKEGYVKRQAIFVCLTCCEGTDAGICLACSLTCHKDHNVHAIYTKRNFRCDCGNKKFPSDMTCELEKEKIDYNLKNVYGCSFQGSFGCCAETLEDSKEEKVQCLVCENWFHFNHVRTQWDSGLETLKEEFEFICGSCTNRLGFLQFYRKFSAEYQVQSDTAMSQVKPSETEPESQSDNSICKIRNEEKLALSTSGDKGSAWKIELRSELCKCGGCMDKYRELQVEFLLDAEDSVQHYETLGMKKLEQNTKQKTSDIQRRLSEFGHAGNLEAARGIGQLRNALGEFLATHNDPNVPISVEDIQKFSVILNRNRNS